MNDEMTPDLVRPRWDTRTVTGGTIFFMVLLRMAIGWHFGYEGVYKLHEQDWRATGYLVQSTGPFRPVFRGMVKDVDGLERLTPEVAARRIDERYAAMVRLYGLTEEQQEAIRPIVERKKGGDPAEAADKITVRAVFADPDFQAQLADYRRLLDEIREQESLLPDFTAYNIERLTYNYAKKARALAALLNRAEAPMRDVEAAVLNRLSPEQRAKGPPPKDPSPTAWIDFANMWGLTLVGVCLLLGLFTRLAALGGVFLLCLYYFSMPPFPGYPQSPISEGHYLIVNKNLIEALALLMIATTRIGRWAGLDGVISWWSGRRAAAAVPRAAGSAG